MTAHAYYNEIDPYAAQWLRNLIAAGHIAAGDVDERSIAEVHPADLVGYDQCHFFAGIGVWSYALRLAGWPDDRPVWTGSCPCQPFSAAGKQEGTADARHLWPQWFRLIGECCPVRVFGEQVGAAIRHGWLDLVSADLEGAGYAVGSAVVGAHSVGAPHIRQRLFFVAQSASVRHEWTGRARRRRDGLADFGSVGELADSPRDGRREECQDAGRIAAGDREEGRAAGLEPSGSASDMGHPDDARPQGRGLRGATGERDGAGERAARPTGDADWMEHTSGERWKRGQTPTQGHKHDGAPSERQESEHGPRIASTYWSDCDWLPCIDGKARPVEPGTFPLAHGAPARVGRLRAYGNAIVAPLAAEFIRAYLSA